MNSLCLHGSYYLCNLSIRPLCLILLNIFFLLLFSSSILLITYSVCSFLPHHVMVFTPRCSEGERFRACVTACPLTISLDSMSPDCFNGLCSTAALCAGAYCALTLCSPVPDLHVNTVLTSDSSCSQADPDMLNECSVCNLCPCFCVCVITQQWPVARWPHNKYSRSKCQHTAEGERQRGAAFIWCPTEQWTSSL